MAAPKVITAEAMKPLGRQLREELSLAPAVTSRRLPPMHRAPAAGSDHFVGKELPELIEPSRPDPSCDGRFTLAEAGWNILRGMRRSVTDFWKELKAHPIREIASFLAMALVNALLPVVGTVVVLLELGQAGLKIMDGVVEAVGYWKKGQPDEAEKALQTTGEGLADVGKVGVEEWLEEVIDIGRVIPRMGKGILAAARKLLRRGKRPKPDKEAQPAGS